MKSEKLQRGFKKMFKQDIRALQTSLNVLFKTSLEDGHYGAKMEKYVKSFQKYIDMPVDGIVCPLLWSLIHAEADKAR